MSCQTALWRQVRSSGSICLKRHSLVGDSEPRSNSFPKTDMLPFPESGRIALIRQYADIAIVSSANQDAVKENGEALGC